MGEEVAATVFTREDRQRYREKVKRCLDVFARMLAERASTASTRSFGLEIELNLTDETGDPAMANAAGARGDRRPRLPDRARRSSTSRSTSRRGCSPATVFAELEETRPREPQPRRGAGAHGRRAHDDDRDPADARPSSTSTRDALQRQPALPAAQRADLRRPRRGPRDRHRRRRAAVDATPTRSPPRRRARACSCTSRSSPSAFARALERRAGDRRRAARGRRQLAVLLRQASCGARRASRCSSRPPTRARRSSRPRACARACGSASAGSPRSSTSSRRTSATSRRCCRCARTRTRSRCSSAATSPQLRRAAAAQRHDLPLEPARSTTSCAAARTCAWRTACCPPARRSSTSSPTPPSTTAWCGCWPTSERPLWTQMSFSAAEENFHAGARDGIDARVYWPGVGEVPAAELVLRRLLPLAHEGLDALGRRRRRPRPAARDHRAPLRRRGATAPTWQAATFHRLYDERGSTAPRRCAR